MSVCPWNPETNIQTCISFVGTIKGTERTKEEQGERPCCGIHLQCTKCTVWNRNVLSFKRTV